MPLHALPITLFVLVALLLLVVGRNVWQLLRHPFDVSSVDTGREILVGLVLLAVAAIGAFVITLLLGIR